MTSSFLSSDLTTRLRRSVLVGGVLFLSLTAANCGDDEDDDDGGTGPSADCLEELNFAGAPFGEDDAESIEVNDSESGSLSTSDPEDEEGYFYDVYTFGTESERDVSITLDPSGFDAMLVLTYPDLELIDIADQEGEVTETLVASVDEGCYVIIVTSFEVSETGSYTLSVED